MTDNLELKKIKHIYIHIPFCLRNCTYCSFFKINYSLPKKEEYIKILLHEIDLYLALFEIQPKTIYFGGGTPSLLNRSEIMKILSKFDLQSCSEITLETNPIQVNSKFINDFSNTPVNRISLGIQSLNDCELTILGRLHRTKDIGKILDILRENDFDNISFDLMYGLPNQTVQNVENSVKKMLEYSPDHFSIYCLSLENDVPLFKEKENIPNDKIVSEMYSMLVTTLEKNKYIQYEISNFAQKGFESKHNLSYWNNKNYLGIGAGASGYINNIRYTNPENLEIYQDNIKNKIIFSNQELLSKNIQEKEFIFLQLRKIQGLNLSEYESRFNNKFLKKYETIIQKLSDFLIISNGFIKLTPNSYFISDEIFSEFF
ncbi:MAG: radical SAM family heme chaperone HemW [Candidatus Cloacimonetes bacterium]|nr:radical SAM family heme chaperone HemW [Candidatus Cloacimonadota bacterium]